MCFREAFFSYVEKLKSPKAPLPLSGGSFLSPWQKCNTVKIYTSLNDSVLNVGSFICRNGKSVNKEVVWIVLFLLLCVCKGRGKRVILIHQIKTNQCFCRFMNKMWKQSHVVYSKPLLKIPLKPMLYTMIAWRSSIK